MGGIAQFEQGEELSPVERCYYEPTNGGGKYWLKIGEKYHSRTERQLARWLKAEGIAASLSKDEIKAGSVLSEVDRALLQITDERVVDFAGPFAGWHSGAQSISGKVVLITESPQLIAPQTPEESSDRVGGDGLRWGGDCAGWPRLAQFLHRGFIGAHGMIEYDQLVYHLAWLKRSYVALAAGEPNQGHAVILAGDPGCGKSLHIAIMTAILGGKLCRPLRYIFGESNFNSEMFTAAHLVVDDEGSKTHIADRMIVKARTKQCVAVSGASCEGKNKDSFELETFKRLTFATNLEEENLLVLPPLDDDLIGKMHCFKFYSGDWPWAESSTKREVWSIVSQELPYFLHWLLNAFELPEEMREDHLRFGVKSFAHPEIVQGIDFLSPEARLWGYIERTVLRDTHKDLKTGLDLPVGEWQGSSVDLETYLKDGDNGLDYKERGKVPPANPTIGKYLSKLAKRPNYQGRITAAVLPGGKKRYWRLLSQERYQLENQEEEQDEMYDPNN